jgi:hypothetical protein
MYITISGWRVNRASVARIPAHAKIRKNENTKGSEPMVAQPPEYALMLREMHPEPKR